MNAISLPYPQNSLYEPLPRPPFRGLNRKGKVMSVVITIKCKDGIVMASDSQTTCDSYKVTRTAKISHLKHGKNNTLVGMAGWVEPAEAAYGTILETLSVFDGSIEAGFCQGFIDYANKVRIGLALDSIEQVRDSIFSTEPFQFLVAYCASNRRSVYTFDSRRPTEELRTPKFNAIGTGGPVALYALGDFKEEEVDCDMGVVLAAFAVSEAKQYDPFCGGSTQISVVKEFRELVTMDRVSEADSFSWATQLSPKEVHDIEGILLEVGSEIRSEMFQEWKRMIEKRTADIRSSVRNKWEFLYSGQTTLKGGA